MDFCSFMQLAIGTLGKTHSCSRPSVLRALCVLLPREETGYVWLHNYAIGQPSSANLTLRGHNVIVEMFVQMMMWRRRRAVPSTAKYEWRMGVEDLMLFFGQGLTWLSCSYVVIWLVDTLGFMWIGLTFGNFPRFLTTPVTLEGWLGNY
jgi:hypothetical protein